MTLKTHSNGFIMLTLSYLQNLAYHIYLINDKLIILGI